MLLNVYNDQNYLMLVDEFLPVYEINIAFWIPMFHIDYSFLSLINKFL